MILNLRIKNREDIGYGYWEENAVLISICVPDLEFAVYNQKYLDVLQLKFHDIDQPVEGCDLMSGYHARAIAEFVNKHKDSVDTIVVNCDAGQSRSAGCAAAIANYVNGDDSQIFKTKPSLNRHVYRLILRAFQVLEREKELNG